MSEKQTGRIRRSKKSLGESTIKAKVLNFLRENKEIASKTLIANELHIPNSSVRADMALFTDEFIGIEIKSEADSLRRFPAQVRAYLSIFDRVIVVLASKHMRHLDWEIVAGAEVWEVDSNGQIFVTGALAADRPKDSLKSLMTQAELKRFGLESTDKSNSKLGRAEERKCFESVFRNRYGETSERFWRAVGRRVIKEEHLLQLSRFQDRRQRHKNWQNAQSKFWQSWKVDAQKILGNEYLVRSIFPFLVGFINAVGIIIVSLKV